LIAKIAKFYKLNLSDKINLIDRYFNIFRTKYFYKYLLKKSGLNNFIRKPILWNPNFIEIGNNCYIGYHCRLEAIRKWNGKSFSPNLIIGDGTSMEQGCHITFADELIIGEKCTLSYNVMITDTDHSYKDIGVDIISQSINIKKTQIGSNCFIGAGAKIQAGTTLGKQCIVGSNSVIRGVFPDYSVIVGIPGKIVKRYNQKTDKWEKTRDNGDFIDE
jgi:acetyltransferase-like isoleucine patch superfamily enzyme